MAVRRGNPLNEIRDLIRQDGPSTGVVVALGVGTVVVATRGGSLRAQDGGLTLSPGDRVRLEGSVVTGVVRKDAVIPTFSV